MSHFQETEIGTIPSEWDYEQLESFFDLITYGFTNPMPTVDEGPYMITAKDINDGRIKYENARKTSEDAYDKLLTDKSRPRINDILITKDASIGRVAIVKKEDLCINQSVALIRPNKRIIPLFLKYLLESPKYQKLIYRDASGSTILHIYITRINKMLIGVPPLKEQDAILGVIHTVQKKIDLLKAQNQTLETIAQTIFKEWFGKYQLGDELPDGWRIGKLGELIEKTIDNRGKTPPLSNEEKHLMLETYQMSAKTPFPNFSQNSKKKYVSSDLYCNWFRSGHPKYLDILFATVGNGIPNWCFMPKNKDEYCIAQNLVAFRAKSEISGVFLKYLFDTRNFIGLCNGIIITTAQPSIKLSHLRLLDIIIPKQELINTFNTTIKPMVDLIFNNTEQIQSLTKTRDTLLPKLMSGQVRVKM